MNNQNKHYQQLTQEPRYQISGLRKAGKSLRAIGQEVEDRIFLLNLTPRKVLGGLTPLEAFSGRRVALIT